MKILFIRHAETPINVQNLMHKTGALIGLTDLGKEQARKLIKICQENNVEKIFASPEQRTKETAQIIGNGIDKQIEFSPKIAERNWGGWEGWPWDDIDKLLQSMRIEDRYTFVPPNGESWQQMESRLSEFLRYLTAKKYKSVAIVTHEGVLRGLMPILLNLPKGKSLDYHFDNGSVTAFEFKDRAFTQVK